jgi:F420-dependent oxidoreductase-like protein
VKLSTILQYSGDVRAAAEEAVAFEAAGLDAIWVPEAYGMDAISILGYVAARTDRLEIGTGVVNVYSRTPTLLAMSAAGLDALSQGRMNLGLGASGPQVIEGFHGISYRHPAARIKETIEVCRRVWRRDVVDFQGSTLEIPLPTGEGTGLGKPLKIINQPFRDRIPCFWGALRPYSVGLAAEVADGWMPEWFIPEKAPAIWGEALRTGLERRPASLPPLEIVAGGVACVSDDPDEVQSALDRVRPLIALYVGGMGAREMNFNHELLRRYGWDSEADKIQELFLTGRKQEAAAAVPSGFLEEWSLAGSRSRVKERVAAYRRAGVTYLQLSLTGPLAERIATIRDFRSIVEEA